VLGAQHSGDVGEFARLFQLREDMLFFQLLVIVLDEASNNRRRGIELLGGKLITRVEATKSFSINQEYAFEHSMLAHQVFGRSDRHIAF
jgi:hypothetical protein